MDDYKPCFLHKKVLIIDDTQSTVGTPNFDNRFFRLNFEVTSVIVDADFAREMETMFEADFAHADVIAPESLYERPLWWRIGVK